MTNPIRAWWLSLSLLGPGWGYAQQWQIDEVGPHWQFIIDSHCTDEGCYQPAQIQLLQQGKLLQRFQSPDLALPKPAASISPYRLSYRQQQSIQVGDFNFDGSLDLAIRNGNRGNYGAPSFDIYLLLNRNQRFVLNYELSQLASNYLGMFQVDAKRKRLIVFEKDGCCWHRSTEYEVHPKRGLYEVASKEEALHDDSLLEVITRTRRPQGGFDSQSKLYNLVP